MIRLKYSKKYKKCASAVMPRLLTQRARARVLARLSLVEVIQSGGVFAGDLTLLLVGHAAQDAVDDGARLGKGRLSMGVVRAPHQIIHADVRPELDAQGIFLEADEDVLAEEIARQCSILKTAVLYSLGPLGIGIVHAVHEIRCPGHLKFDRPHFQARIALKDPTEDESSNGAAHITFAVGKLDNVLGWTALHPWLPAVGPDVQAQGHSEILSRGPQWLIIRVIVAFVHRAQGNHRPGQAYVGGALQLPDRICHVIDIEHGDAFE